MKTDCTGGYRILVVDDHPDTVEVVCTLFSVLGHEAYGVMNGKEGLEKARLLEPDIVLIDLSMPILGGIEVAERLRMQHGSRPYLVALTGWDRDEDRHAAHVAGFDQYVLKPAAGVALREVVEGYVIHERARARRSRARMFSAHVEA